MGKMTQNEVDCCDIAPLTKFLTHGAPLCALGARQLRYKKAFTNKPKKFFTDNGFDP